MSHHCHYVCTFPVVNVYHKASQQTFVLAVLHWKLINASSKTYKEPWHPLVCLGDKVWQTCSRHSSWIVSAHIWKGLLSLAEFFHDGTRHQNWVRLLIAKSVIEKLCEKVINGWFRAMFLKCHNQFMNMSFYKKYMEIFHLESSGHCVLAFTYTVLY